jgi:hypothetical protein
MIQGELNRTEMLNVLSQRAVRSEETHMKKRGSWAAVPEIQTWTMIWTIYDYNQHSKGSVQYCDRRKNRTSTRTTTKMETPSRFPGSLPAAPSLPH